MEKYLTNDQNIKKKIIDKAKNIISRLTQFNPQINNSNLKNEIFIFFRDQSNNQTELKIKEVITLLYQQELELMNLLPNKNKSTLKNKEEILLKNNEEKKINEESLKNRKNKRNKKKPTANEKLEDNIKIIERDKGIKIFLKNNFKQQNVNIFGNLPGKDKLNEFDEKGKEKILTMVCLFYPFLTKDQKDITDREILYNLFDEKSTKNLNNCLLVNKTSNNIQNFLNLLIKEIISNNDKLLLLQEMENEIINIDLENQELIGHQTYIKNFQLYLLYKLFKNKNYNKVEDFINKLLFKLQLILYTIYYQSNNYPYNLVHDCLMNKKLLNSLYNKEKFNDFIHVEYNYDGDGNNNFYWNEFSLTKPSLSKIHNLKTNDLFSYEQRKLYNYCFYQLKYFYSYDIKSIIACRNGGNDLKFLLNFYEGVSYIDNYKRKISFQKYKNILSNLEYEIFNLVKENYNINNKKSEKLYRYKMYNNFKIIFNEINLKFHENFKNYNFTLYPYGSITKFNGSNNSDLDIYLQIDLNDKENAIEFIEKLFDYIKNNLDNEIDDPTISTRLCVISFKYKNILIDLNIVGNTPYLHSNLFRLYGLLDNRFSILVLCIKYIIKEMGLKSIANETSFLNSFSWEMLLKAFLQDIIKPPVLPKLIENSEQKRINIKLGNLFINNDGGKNLRNFIYDIYNEKINIPDLNYDEAKKIYRKTIKEKNKMPVSELLLKFLFFVIFIFKGDSIYVNNTKDKEGFENIIAIFKPKTVQDKKFRYYFRTKYRKYDSKKGVKKEGVFVFRDPFDAHYNSGQSFKESHEELFYNKLKKVYYHLMETGTLVDMNK